VKKPMPPSGPLPLPAPPTGRVNTPAAGARVITPAGTPKVSSGKFPDLSNLPTMIAEPDETPPPGASPSPELAPTAMAGDLVDPNRRSMQMEAQQPPPNNGMPQQRTSGQMQPMDPRPSSQQIPRQSMQQMQPPPSNLPMSYPVMDKAMSQEMRAGGSVFPSARRGGVPDSGPHDPQRAADLASPVGAQYGGDVDWSQAAAMPARSIPPWMLGVIFVAAIGIALAITIIIAKLVR
jgi:hypothetical protein